MTLSQKFLGADYSRLAFERDWSELCFQEQVGLARAAIIAQPGDPVDWMFKELHITRRHNITTEIFKGWVKRIKYDQEG